MRKQAIWAVAALAALVSPVMADPAVLVTLQADTFTGSGFTVNGAKQGFQALGIDIVYQGVIGGATTINGINGFSFSISLGGPAASQVTIATGYTGGPSVGGITNLTMSNFIALGAQVNGRQAVYAFSSWDVATAGTFRLNPPGPAAIDLTEADDGSDPTRVGLPGDTGALLAGGSVLTPGEVLGRAVFYYSGTTLNLAHLTMTLGGRGMQYAQIADNGGDAAINVVTPEPATMGLAAVGLGALAARRRRRK